jgi:four helix bundle protein
MKRFHVLEVSLQVVRQLRPASARLAKTDPALFDQIRRAASSIALNIAEGRRRVGKDRLHLWRIAAGSADEVRSALRVAEAWGQIDGREIADVLVLLDRVLAMLWRLTH